MKHLRPTRAEVDLGAIASNVRTLASLTDEHVERLAVVKANAYGHGDVEVSRACLGAGATRLGVALVEEGIRLRDAGIDAPILVLVDSARSAAGPIVEHDLTASLFATRDGADALDAAAQASRKRVKVHICVDTGMHREGVAVEDALEFVGHVARLPNLEIEGIWSHLASADEQDEPFTFRQLETFLDICARVEDAGYEIPLRHLGNSAANIAHPKTHFDLVRMGIAIYGLYPAPWMRTVCDLVPAMRLVSEIALTRRVEAGEAVSYGLTYRVDRPAWIANVPIGYGDGLPRSLSNVGEALIGGKRRPIAGRVTMDTIMVDCGDDEVAPGDEVVLIGKQGDDEITADEIAEKLGTINYEIVTCIGPRVPRVYSR